MWRILWSHAYGSGDFMIGDFVDLIGQTISDESNEELVTFLLDRVSHCIKMGLLHKNQMCKSLQPGTVPNDLLTSFRDDVLKVKLFDANTTSSL